MVPRGQQSLGRGADRVTASTRFCFSFFFSGRLQSLWDLNKGWNLGPGSENMESSPLDHQGIPKYHISELCLGIDSFERSV